MKNVLLAGIALIVCAIPASPAPEKTPPCPRTDRYGDPLPEGAIARLGTRRMRGCSGPIVFSPDGKHIVTAGGDGNAQAVFWDIGTGRRVKALTAKGTISRLAFSPDGKQLAAINGGYFNPLWDVATGKELFLFTGSTSTFSADGKKLLCTYSDSQKTAVRSYDTATGKQQAEGSSDLPLLRSFTLSADGQFAAVTNGGPSISVFDLRKKEEVKKLLGVHIGGIGMGGFSHDGRRLVARGANGWAAWDWASGKSLRAWSGQVRNAPAFSPDGRRLAWIGADEETALNSLWVMDLDGGRPRLIGAIDSHTWAHPAAFSADGKKLAVVTEGDALALVDSQTGRDLLPFDAHTSHVWSVAYTSDARYAITRDSRRLLVWDADTGRLLRRLPDDLPDGEAVLLNTVSQGRIVTFQPADKTLRLRDLVTGKELRRLKGQDSSVASAPWDVSAVSPDGSSVAIRGATGVHVYNLDNGDIRCHFSPEHPIWGMGFSADGRTLVVTIQDFQKGLLTTFRDARTGRNVKSPATPIVRASPDGRWREGDEEAKAKLRRMKLLDAQGQLAFAGEDGLLTSVYESPGGRCLAVQGRTGSPHVIDDTQKQFLRVWDRTSRRLVLDLDTQRGMAQTAGFSPDGRTFVSTSYSPRAIVLWEIATGRERLRLAGHLTADVKIAFRPDGRALLSGGADTQVFLWDLTGRASMGERHDTPPTPERLAEYWRTLAGEDAAAAYRAMWSLVAAPEQTLAWMRKYLRPVAPVTVAQLSRLLADLDSDSFAVRAKAARDLETLGEQAESALRRTLEGRPTLESRRRCEELLEKLAVLSPERRRAIRAIEAIEHIGTAEARSLLERLRQGAPEARLTREAQAALDRLAARSAAAP